MFGMWRHERKIGRGQNVSGLVVVDDRAHQGILSDGKIESSGKNSQQATAVE
jgi:hypothetical protein